MRFSSRTMEEVSIFGRNRDWGEDALFFPVLVFSTSRHVFAVPYLRKVDMCICRRRQQGDCRCGSWVFEYAPYYSNDIVYIAE